MQNAWCAILMPNYMDLQILGGVFGAPQRNGGGGGGVYYSQVAVNDGEPPSQSGLKRHLKIYLV